MTVAAVSYAGIELHQKSLAQIRPPVITLPAVPSSIALASYHAPILQAQTIGLPARLIIPALNVDALVGYMGRTAQGNMAVPTNVADTGWYKYGAMPGTEGTAVIAGHIDGLAGQPGVFAGLAKLQRGDGLTVFDNQGRSATFVVRKISVYDQNAAASEVFTSSGGAHLNLITCTGAWDRTNRHFMQRLVVFTDRSG